jgi:hypothetical protein
MVWIEVLSKAVENDKKESQNPNKRTIKVLNRITRKYNIEGFMINTV